MEGSPGSRHLSTLYPGTTRHGRRRGLQGSKAREPGWSAFAAFMLIYLACLALVPLIARSRRRNRERSWHIYPVIARERSGIAVV